MNETIFIIDSILVSNENEFEGHFENVTDEEIDEVIFSLDSNQTEN